MLSINLNVLDNKKIIEQIGNLNTRPHKILWTRNKTKYEIKKFDLNVFTFSWKKFWTTLNKYFCIWKLQYHFLIFFRYWKD